MLRYSDALILAINALKYLTPLKKKKKSLSVEMAGATSHDIYIAVSTTHCERAA
jgi:hypothetical protein